MVEGKAYDTHQSNTYRGHIRSISVPVVPYQEYLHYGQLMTKVVVVPDSVVEGVVADKTD